MQSLSKCVCERDALALMCQECCPNDQETHPMAGHWVYIDTPSKTSRYTLFCEVVDRPRFKNRIIRRYKPVSQSAFNACQNYPLQPWWTVRAPGADRPQLCVPHHQRRTSSLVQL